MSTNKQMKVTFGEVEEAKIIKAGCGTRYDPEQLGDHSGFDFSAARHLKPSSSETCDSEIHVDSNEEPNETALRSNMKE